MWKRPEGEPHAHQTLDNTSLIPEHRMASRPTIGIQTVFKGEIKGSDDLSIEGKIEGRIDCPTACITICSTGAVLGEINARVINIEGEMHGDVVAAERVRVARTGTVIGNISAATVALEEGAKLRGMIDMEPAQAPLTISVIPNVFHDLRKTQDKLVELQLAPQVINGGY